MAPAPPVALVDFAAFVRTKSPAAELAIPGCAAGAPELALLLDSTQPVSVIVCALLGVLRVLGVCSEGAWPADCAETPNESAADNIVPKRI